MALRAVKPSTVKKRLKFFAFGAAGAGKTWSAIRFPSSYFIDCEAGAVNEQYVAALEKAGGVYFPTNDLEEIITEVRHLLTEKHPYRTLVIDPVTTAYNNAVDASARELARKAGGDSDGTEFGRHKLGPDRAMKRLMALCTQLDMNVVMTAHSKGKWEKVGDKVEQVGNTFDAYQKADYLFDLVLEIQARGRDDRVAIVRKSRIEAFPLGDVFTFSYEELSHRYGREVLERKAGAVELASPDQVARIRHLVDVLKIEPELVDKWNTKANTDQFEEYPRELAAKVLDGLNAKFANTPTAPASA